VDRTDHGSVLIFYGLDMHTGPDRRSVGALEFAFDPAYGSSGSQHKSHRRLVARDLPAAEIELVGAAIFLTLTRGTRAPSPQFGRMRVEPEDTSVAVTRINGEGQLIQSFGRGIEYVSTASARGKLPDLPRGELFHFH